MSHQVVVEKKNSRSLRWKGENSVDSFILRVLFATLRVESLRVILCYNNVRLVAFEGWGAVVYEFFGCCGN